MPQLRTSRALIALGVLALAVGGGSMLFRDSPPFQGQVTPLLSCCPGPGAGACVPDLTFEQCDALGPDISFIYYTADTPRAVAQDACNTLCGAPTSDADLQARVICSCGAVEAGGAVRHQCRIVVVNGGPDDAANVTATVTLGGNARVLGASVTPLVIQGGAGQIPVVSATDGGTQIIWSGGSPLTMAGGNTAEATVHFVAAPGTNGQGTVTMTVAGSDENDAFPINDTANANLPDLSTCGGGTECPAEVPLCTGITGGMTCPAGETATQYGDPIACTGGACYDCVATSSSAPSSASSSLSSSSSSTSNRPSACGDGAVVTGEACDDGNTANGDGCSSSCQVESGYRCTNAPAGSCPACDGQCTVPTGGGAPAPQGGCPEEFPLCTDQSTWQQACETPENLTLPVEPLACPSGQGACFGCRDWGGGGGGSGPGIPTQCEQCKLNQCLAALPGPSTCTPDGSSSSTQSSAQSSTADVTCPANFACRINGSTAHPDSQFRPSWECGFGNASREVQSGTCTISGQSGTCVQCEEIPPGCGDGDLDDDEECEDGNTADGDGCSATCRIEDNFCSESSSSGGSCPQNSVTSQAFVQCQGSAGNWPVLCNPAHTFTMSTTAPTTLRLQYFSPDGEQAHCARTRYHVSIDGQAPIVSGWIGYQGGPPPLNFTMNFPNIQPGSHTFSVKAEGDGTVCDGSPGGIGKWAGDFIVTALTTQCGTTSSSSSAGNSSGGSTSSPSSTFSCPWGVCTAALTSGNQCLVRDIDSCAPNTYPVSGGTCGGSGCSGSCHLCTEPGWLEEGGEAEVSCFDSDGGIIHPMDQGFTEGPGGRYYDSCVDANTVREIACLPCDNSRHFFDHKGVRYYLHVDCNQYPVDHVLFRIPCPSGTTCQNGACKP